MKRSTTYIHGPPQPVARDMLTAGIDIIPDKKNNIGAKREKRGECPTCGVPTHKVAMFGKPKPLTVEGQVYKGRCLVCYPLEGYIRRPVVASGNNHVPFHVPHQQYGGVGVGVGPPPPHHHLHPQHRTLPQQSHLASFRVPVPINNEPSQRFGRPPTGQPMPDSYPRQHQPLRHSINHQQQQYLEEARFHTEGGVATTIPQTLRVHGMGDDISVITIDPALKKVARTWTRTNECSDEDSDDEEDEMLPLSGRRPGPDSGDSYAGGGGGSGGDILRRPPLRTTGSSSYGDGMGGGGPVGAAAARMGGDSYRRSERNSLPLAQERARERSYRQLLAEQQQQHHHNGHHPMHHHPSIPGQQQQSTPPGEQGVVGPAFDADGYPVATSGYGWDKQADLLPPGGMDMLLQNRSGEVRLPVAPDHRQSATHGEIRFQPLVEEPAGESSLEEYEERQQQQQQSTPVELFHNEYRPYSAGRNDAHASFPTPRRMESIASGPMFLPDDVPAAYTDDGVTAAAATSMAALTRLEAQRSEPVRPPPPGENGTPALAPPLRSHRTEGGGGGGSKLPRNAVGGDYSDYGFNHLPRAAAPGTRFDSKQSTAETGSYCASTVASTLAPPLVSRDRRGRPDDDMIHDPAMAIQSTTTSSTYPGVMMDDQKIDENQNGAEAPTSMPLNHITIGERQAISASLKAPPTRYVPEMSNSDFMLDDQVDDNLDDDDDQSQTSMPQSHIRSGEMQAVSGSLKAPPTRYVPEISNSDFMLDDQVDDNLDDRSQNGEMPVSRNEPLAQFMPDLSPQGTNHHRVNMESELMQPQGPSNSAKSSGLMYIEDMDEPNTGLSYKLPFVDGKAKAAAAAAPANQKVPLPDHPHNNNVASFPHPSERGNEMIRNRPEQNGVTRITHAGAQHVNGVQQTTDDIPIIMQCLNLRQANASMREKALRSLASILWTSGRGRECVLQLKGVETLVGNMWDNMSIADVQDAAAEFLLSLAASCDARADNDLLANEDTYCDSLLFAMQTHPMVASIQLKGCAIFSCLASASSNNSKVSDGSLSGAQMMVLSAMNNHARSEEIQKAGLQALYYQCTLSSNAESNKRSLVDSRLDDGASGLDVILNSMKTLQEDLVAIEWACRLCWSLTGSEDLVKSTFSKGPAMIQEIIYICQRNITGQESDGIMEACFGVIGNMAHLDANRFELLQQDAVGTLIEGMRYRPGDFSLNLEACSAIANLAVSNPIRDAFLQAGAIDRVLFVLQKYIDNDEFVTEAMRALVCLAVHSHENKEVMVASNVIGIISAVSSTHEESNLVQEMCCKLLATLVVGRATTVATVSKEGLDLLVRVLQSSSDEKVQEAACLAYRNFSCILQNVDSLLWNGSLTSLINAMARHEKSLSIQTNCCCALWNIAFHSSKEPGDLVGQQGVEVIVKAMQTHMESSDLLEVACGALWSVIDGSIDRKKDLVGCGAIDAVVCTLVMHPTVLSTLVKACGVFSNLSAEGPLAEAIADAQGVSVVSDAVRNNGSAVTLLEIGCQTLRNIVLQFPEYAQDASMAISPIIDAMRENITAASFQQAACNLLWVLAAESESCQSKILSLDGFSIVMQCLEQNNNDEKVRQAALGAIKQLTASGNQT